MALKKKYWWIAVAVVVIAVAAAAFASKTRGNGNKEEEKGPDIPNLAAAIDEKDPYTRGHSERVGVYASKIAREMGFTKEFIERVYIAGLLHDVGKIGVPDEILLKPGRLTDEEFRAIKMHPVIGVSIIEPINFPWNISAIIRWRSAPA